MFPILVSAFEMPTIEELFPDDEAVIDGEAISTISSSAIAADPQIDEPEPGGSGVRTGASERRNDSDDEAVVDSEATNSVSSGAIPADPQIAEPEPGGSEVRTGASGRRKQLYSEEISIMWNLKKIFTVFDTKEQCIAFAEANALLPTQKMCRVHTRPMYIDNSVGQVGAFRCNKGLCRTKKISRAVGTWFENAHLSLPLIFQLMYCFCAKYSYDQTQIETSSTRQTVLSTKTIADWYNYCRETICVYELENETHHGQIGGVNKIVQIDESKFGRRKYNRGRQVEGHWVIGMIEDTSDDLRLELCPDNERSAEALVPLIKKHVREGSIIHTDYWRAYDCLPEHGYIHRKCNHSDPVNKFVAPDGTHTQRIESHWRGLKRAFHMDQYKSNFLDWLVEFSWRRKNKINFKDNFLVLIDAVKYVYKVNNE